METSIEHNEKKCRFDLIVDGQAGGYLTYDVYDGCLDIRHTVVNYELRGNKLGDVLIDAAVKYADEKGLKIVPTCGFARKLLDHNDG